jgi:deoxyribonuclease V
LAHPRRFGIASHLGVLLDKPTIGVAKSVLVGRVGELAEEAGSMAELVEGSEILGVALRTRPKIRPVYVSVGHRVDLPSAIRMVLNCTSGYRLPEPCRLAHRLASSSFKVGR